MAQLFDESPRPVWEASRFPVEKWRSLMDDCTVLRVVDNGTLKSVRSDHYDDWILRWCPHDWTKWHRVIGDATGHASQAIDHWFLQWRLQELIASGAIECQGTLPMWDEVSKDDLARIRRAI
jgi:hypothetical protein